MIVNMQDGAIQAPQDRQDPGDQCYVDTTTGQQNAQRWRVIPGQGPAQGRGVHIVMADGGGFCLDIDGERYEDGTRIITWLNESKPNQTWVLQPV